MEVSPRPRRRKRPWSRTVTYPLNWKVATLSYVFSTGLDTVLGMEPPESGEHQAIAGGKLLLRRCSPIKLITKNYQHKEDGVGRRLSLGTALHSTIPVFLTLGFPWPSKLGQGSSHSGFQYAHVIVWQNLKLNWPARHVRLHWISKYLLKLLHDT